MIFITSRGPTWHIRWQMATWTRGENSLVNIPIQWRGRIHGCWCVSFNGGQYIGRGSVPSCWFKCKTRPPMSHADFLTCQTVWCLCSMIDVMCTVGNIVPLEGGTFIPLTNIYKISAQNWGPFFLKLCTKSINAEDKFQNHIIRILSSWFLLRWTAGIMKYDTNAPQWKSFRFTLQCSMFHPGLLHSKRIDKRNHTPSSY